VFDFPPLIHVCLCHQAVVKLANDLEIAIQSVAGKVTVNLVEDNDSLPSGSRLHHLQTLGQSKKT